MICTCKEINGEELDSPQDNTLADSDDGDNDDDKLHSTDISGEFLGVLSSLVLQPSYCDNYKSINIMMSITINFVIITAANFLLYKNKLILLFICVIPIRAPSEDS